MIVFSIITCTFNAGKVLQRTLDSVLAQTYSHVEHIIVDGASTDGTVSMAEAYRQKSDAEDWCHEVHVKSEPDRGLYDAMNKGIQRATGQYVLFLNAGDTFPAPDTLETVAESVGEGEELPAVLYGDTDVVDGEGHFLRHRRLAAPRRLTWRSFMRGMLVCHQAFYARTDLAKATPYDLRYRYSADVDWCIRIMRLARRRRLSLRNVGAVVVNFLDGGLTTAHHRASLRERFRIMARHYGFFPTVLMHAWFVVRSMVIFCSTQKLVFPLTHYEKKTFC